MIEFEFDFAKSQSNRRKHGIDFVEAQALWLDVSRVEIPAQIRDEPRVLTVGRIGEKYWTAVITSRGAKTRIISVRRSRVEEIRMYES